MQALKSGLLVFLISFRQRLPSAAGAKVNITMPQL